MATVLKALLRQRHLQTISAFNREYDRIARTVDPDLVGEGPKKAQFYRWLSGDVSNLPYPHHCRILEAMFPGKTAVELFSDCSASEAESHVGTPGSTLHSQSDPVYAGVEAIYVNRAQFIEALPPRDLFGSAKTIDMAGLSLNLLCQQYSDAEILSLIRSGATIRCLFLDPEGVGVRQREAEEGYEPGVLSGLTTLNMHVILRLRARLAPDEAADNVHIRTYDETIRFNIVVVDDERCVVQPYLPYARGVESPTIVSRRSPTPGIFDTFTQVFESMWTNGKEVAPL
jgi:hypothetical protein